MQLESVRALKVELAEALVRPLIEESHGLATFGISARSLRRVTGVRPGVALGITRGRNKRDYQLAVRVQQRTMEQEAGLRERFTATTKGELDYRYIGRVTKQQLPW